MKLYFCYSFIEAFNLEDFFSKFYGYIIYGITVYDI